MPTPPKTLRAGLVQHACTGNRDETLARTETGIRQAAAQGAQLIVLQDDLSADISFDGYDSTGDNYAVLEVSYVGEGGSGGTGSARSNRLLLPRAA